jgi:hypothetical protein
MQIKGQALKLLTSNIDTDQIIPARHLTGISKTGLGIYLFEDVPNNPLDAIEHDDCRVVLTLDKDERKMSLGIKQMTPDPWTDITAKYPVGSKHKGTVRNFTNFGIAIKICLILGSNFTLND